MPRTLCIVFMTFVHVQPGIAENVNDRDTGFFDIIYFILTRIVGLSSVSLLSIVSGYFVVSSLLKAGPQPLAVSKLKTLVVPLVAWNLVMFMLLVAYGLLSGKWQDMPDATVVGVANAFLALTAWPLDVPLWFLRDLFVCCLFTAASCEPEAFGHVHLCRTRPLRGIWRGLLYPRSDRRSSCSLRLACGCASPASVMRPSTVWPVG